MTYSAIAGAVNSLERCAAFDGLGGQEHGWGVGVVRVVMGGQLGFWTLGFGEAGRGVGDMGGGARTLERRPSYFR